MGEPIIQSFKCIPLEGETVAEKASHYQHLINSFFNNPQAIYVDEIGRQVYMRPYVYSCDNINGEPVANITLAGTFQEPNRIKSNKYEF